MAIEECQRFLELLAFGQRSKLWIAGNLVEPGLCVANVLLGLWSGGVEIGGQCQVLLPGRVENLL